MARQNNAISFDLIASYVKDTKGDRQNLVYGNPDQYSIPKYRSAGYGSLIGLSRDYKIVKSSGSRREVLRGGIDSSQKPKTHSILSSLAPEAKYAVKFDLGNDNEEIINQRNFVSVRSRTSNKGRRLSPAHEAETELANLSADGFDSSSSSDVDAGTVIRKTDAFEAFRNDPVRKLQLELFKRTENDPENIQAWFELVHLQESLTNDHDRDESRRDVPSAQRRSVIDLKISILQQALAKVRSQQNRQRLVEEMMREGSKIWDRTRQIEEWQIVLQKESFFELWLLYLNFRQTDSSKFSIDQTIDFYNEYLEAIRAKPPANERDQQMIHLILRFTLLLQQSGFQERAVGIWQGLLELNSFRSTAENLEQSLSKFERFWDTESARLGEASAKGWTSESIQEVIEHKDPVRERIDKKNVLGSWAGIELAAMKVSIMPARTIDETAEDDPFRVILYSDLKPYLFVLSSPESLPQLLNAFAIFAGLPSIYQQPHPARWTTDSLIFPMVHNLSQSHEDGYSSRGLGLPFNGITDTLTIFDTDQNCFSAFSKKIADKPYSSFASRALQQISVARPQDEYLSEYILGLELQLSSKSVRKLTKSILKSNANSLRLYNAYALIEYRLGNTDKAEKVWSTALSISGSDEQNKESDSLLLWHSWILECMRSGKPNKALALLASISNGRPNAQLLENIENISISASSHLKIETHLKSHLSTALSLKHLEIILACTNLLAFHAYLRNNCTLESAMNIYSSTQEALSTRHISSSTIETLHQYRAHFLHLHAISKGVTYKTKEIITYLTTSLHLFTSNTIFLSLYHHYTSKSGLLLDRLRTSFDPFSLPHSQSHPLAPAHPKTEITSRLYAIRTEIVRPTLSHNGNVHAIRSAFQRALDSDTSTRSSPALHVAYLRWEISQLPDSPPTPSTTTSSSLSKSERRKHDTATKPAIAAFHAALRAVPWVKEVYLLGLGNAVVRDSLGPDGVRVIYEMMIDRGIRVHVDTSDLIRTVI